MESILLVNLLLSNLRTLVKKWRDEAHWRDNDQYYTMHANELEQCIEKSLQNERIFVDRKGTLQ